MAEVRAKNAANEKLHAHELTVNAMLAREELDRHLTEVEREEFQRINTEIETGKLMTKLRKTSLVSKISQIGLAASLAFSLSYMFTTGPSGTVADNAVRASEAKVNIAPAIVADAVVAKNQSVEPVVLASLQMAKELSNLQSSGLPPENLAKN
jgi:hypothetical protein